MKKVKINYTVAIMEDMGGNEMYFVIDKNSPKYSPYFAYACHTTLEGALHLKDVLTKEDIENGMEYTTHLPSEYLLDSYNGTCKVLA